MSLVTGDHTISPVTGDPYTMSLVTGDHTISPVTGDPYTMSLVTGDHTISPVTGDPYTMSLVTGDHTISPVTGDHYTLSLVTGDQTISPVTDDHMRFHQQRMSTSSDSWMIRRLYCQRVHGTWTKERGRVVSNSSPPLWTKTADRVVIHRGYHGRGRQTRRASETTSAVIP
ncbi:hypothetical protein NQ318_008811 [Aromia moschata]|uniref:Uncharacterized protein n=1 Tax=Aromia moschata TaxID=1265417 RepID=A0AAV8ZA98_9CUCU|nr:hypothetical protein NQ318_008811 [Aromia moschata]